MRLRFCFLLQLLPALLFAQPTYDLVIVGGTPGGIMTAVAAARQGHSALLLERTAHIGGLPANGLGATDIGTRGATTGLFLEFIRRLEAHYRDTYGEDSPQFRDASQGYHFEPSVAEQVFEQLLAEQPLITVRKRRQFDALPENVHFGGRGIAAITVTNRDSGEPERYAGRIFVDATYEGDLIAAAGAPFRTGREGQAEFGEPGAGTVYKYWGGPEGPGSHGLADNAVQAYNYRLCLTQDQANFVPIPKPARYDRREYLSLVEDVQTGRHTGYEMAQIDPETAAAVAERVRQGLNPRLPGQPEGMQRLVNKVVLPNGKTDANNQHLAFISTDLPEENWPWPTSSWAWRDRYAERLRDYTLGLLWFAQHDTALPGWFREKTLSWGLAADEYTDNDHFPRQVYVREGRRLEGLHFFTAQDALPVVADGRPPVYANSITASHYALDSHATRKREPGRVHLEGFLSYKTKPYTVPYGVIVPPRLGNLLSPVPVSGSHIGFSTLRMEPCWMALGQAAGTAAALALTHDLRVQEVPVDSLQARLLAQGATLIYLADVPPAHPDFAWTQQLALAGYLPGWEARLEEPVSEAALTAWRELSGLPLPAEAGQTRRREVLETIWQAMRAK